MASSMRIGLFADVEGEPVRLYAALAALQAEGCDRLVCLGNLVSPRGPFDGSATCIEVAERGGVAWVAGPAERLREADLQLPASMRHRLGELPAMLRDAGAVLCRGSPLRPEKGRRVEGGFDAALALRRLRASVAFHAGPAAGAYIGRETPTPFMAADASALELGRPPALVTIGSLAANVPTVAVVDRSFRAIGIVRWVTVLGPIRRAA